MKSVLILLLALLCFVASKKKCDGNSPKGDVCYMRADKARPTQLLYGRLASKCKSEIFEKLKHEDDIEAFLEENPVPAVVGLNGELFITDHHHLLRSYLDADLKTKSSDRVVKVNVIENWSNLDENTFWSQMKANNYAYLYDSQGREDLKNLPTDVTGLKNDPFRSLSYIVRVHGGYQKSKTFFAEFVWGNFFKSIAQFAELSKYSDKKAKEELGFVKNILKDALSVAHSSGASNLPGYSSEQGKMKLPGCKSIDELMGSNKHKRKSNLYDIMNLIQ